MPLAVLAIVAGLALAVTGHKPAPRAPRAWVRSLDADEHALLALGMISTAVH